jgi:hypothetical protein
MASVSEASSKTRTHCNVTVRAYAKSESSYKFPLLYAKARTLTTLGTNWSHQKPVPGLERVKVFVAKEWQQKLEGFPPHANSGHNPC